MASNGEGERSFLLARNKVMLNWLKICKYCDETTGKMHQIRRKIIGGTWPYCPHLTLYFSNKSERKFQLTKRGFKPFLVFVHTTENTRKPKVSCRFQEVKNGKIGQKWNKQFSKQMYCKSRQNYKTLHW